MADNVWTNGSADGKASTAGNWSLEHIPSDSETAVFNATSTANCDWDIATLVYGISLATGYSGTVTQNAATDILIGAGGYTQAAGTFTGDTGRTVTCAGDWTQTAGTVTTNKIKIIFSGTGKTFSRSSSWNFYSISITGTLTASSDISSSGQSGSSVSLGASASLTIATGKVFNCPLYNGVTYSNAGAIEGAGTLNIIIYDASVTTSFGAINCPATIKTHPSAAASRTLTLGANTIFGSTLEVSSSHATYTCTLALAGKSLQCTTLTIGARGIISSNAPATLTATSIILGASGTFTEANITFDRTKVTGQSITWAAAAPANASASTSWNLARAPWHNDLVIFDATSVNNCSWDIDAATVTVGSITIASGYSGTITQAATADIGIGAGGFSMAGGTLTGEGATKAVKCDGSFNHAGGTITSAKLRLITRADGSVLTFTGNPVLLYLEINGNATLNGSLITSGAGGFVTAQNKTLTIGNGATYDFRYYIATTYSNAGTIAATGTGKIQFTLFDINKAVTFGTITAPVTVALISNGDTNHTMTLGANTVLGSSLTIISGHATYTITLDQSGKSLTCSSLTVSTRGVLTNSGAEADCLVSGAFTLSGASSVVSGAVKLNCGSYVQSDGTLTQASDIAIGSGGAAISGGTFTGSATKKVTDAGDFTKTGGTVTTSVLCLVMSGTSKTISSNTGLVLNKLIVSGSISILSNVANLGDGGRLEVTGSLNLAGRYDDYLPQNAVISGNIAGTQTYQMIVPASINLPAASGTISCPVRMYILNNAGGSFTATLVSNRSFSSTLLVDSAHAANTMTLDLAGRSLTANGITIGTRGVLLGGEGVIRNYGSFDSSAGTWTPETSQYIQLGNGTIKLAANQTFYDYLNAPNTTVTRGSDITVSHEYGNGGIVIPGAFTLTTGTSYDLLNLPLEMKPLLSPIIHPNGKRFMRKLERVL